MVHVQHHRGRGRGRVLRGQVPGQDEAVSGQPGGGIRLPQQDHRGTPWWPSGLVACRNHRRPPAEVAGVVGNGARLRRDVVPRRPCGGSHRVGV